MRLFIRPNDILMFRDGKPFAGGDDHFARGVFPPPPSTIYGALRSHILSTAWPEFNKYASGDASGTIKKEIGSPEKNGSLTIRQFTLAKKTRFGVQQFFPIPKDVVRQKGVDNSTLNILKPESTVTNKIKTDLPSNLFHLWYPKEEALESVTGFLFDAAMLKYLQGETPDIYTEPQKLYETEERTGIRKSKTSRSVETGGLYSVEYYRLNEGVGFVVEVDGTELLPNAGLLRLGGDHRSANYTEISWSYIPAETIKEKIAQQKRFKIVLTTPAIFKNGWFPEAVDKKTFEGNLNSIPVKLIGACVGKPVGVGGFDLVKRMPKIMKRAVPAGSIYYFELKNNNIDELFKQVWLKSISDKKAQEGFGVSLIGGY
jgi:CRISPR-associated protein Cmr3